MTTRRGWDLAWLAQAALIVLPVAVLSGVAFHFLREDKDAIIQDARDRAGSLASEIAGRISTTDLSQQLMRAAMTGSLVGEIVDGHAVAVPEYSRVPVPDDWPARLSSSQAQSWRSARE